MKYIVIADVSPEVGTKLEADPASMQEFLGKWQALNPIGMYASLDKRRITVILEAENEDALVMVSAADPSVGVCGALSCKDGSGLLLAQYEQIAQDVLSYI